MNEAMLKNLKPNIREAFTKNIEQLSETEKTLERAKEKHQISINSKLQSEMHSTLVLIQEDEIRRLEKYVQKLKQNIENLKEQFLYTHIFIA